MSRYIDADMITYQNYIRVDGCCSAETEPYVTKNFIDDMPEEDVAPVVHGRWLPIINKCLETTHYICSNCRAATFKRNKTKYCPHCCAKMEE